MTKTKTIPFSELRRFLQGLGYAEKLTDTAHVFHRRQANMLVFRRYADGDDIDASDLASTRRFLDMWGLLDETAFDNFLSQAGTPA